MVRSTVMAMANGTAMDTVGAMDMAMANGMVTVMDKKIKNKKWKQEI